MRKSLSLFLPVLLCAALFYTSGCASHFQSLPTAQEFSKPLSELKQQYPELSRYEPSFGRYMCTAIWKMPYAEDLVAKWGEPDEWHVSWWNLVLGCVIPPFHPTSRWYWYMEDKTVEALIDHPLAYLYEPHVFTLKVLEKAGNRQE